MKDKTPQDILKENIAIGLQSDKVGIKKRTLNRAMQRQELVYNNFPNRASEINNLNFMIKNS